MCELCDEETRAGAIRAHKNLASKLRFLARNMDDMAAGHIKPHTAQASQVGSAAKSVIKELATEWL